VDVGSGGGYIRIDGVPADSYPYNLAVGSGVTVTLEAVPRPGYVFSGWGGDLLGKGNPAALVMTCDKSAIAAFSLDRLLIGSAIGALVLIAAFAAVLIARRQPERTGTEPQSLD
jgi:uncharacterized repeat protein (TIGR02543 family)